MSTDPTTFIQVCLLRIAAFTTWTSFFVFEYWFIFFQWQGAIPDILEKTKEEFFSSVLETLRECSESCYEEIKKIPCITCPYKPEASMFTMVREAHTVVSSKPQWLLIWVCVFFWMQVKLELSVLEDIKDDLEFCCKLAKEESLIILPGRSVGLKNWLRITFAVEPELLKDGLSRLNKFAQRHSKKKQQPWESLSHSSPNPQAN